MGPFQLVLLPTVPGFLYPLLSQLLGNGNVLVPLLLGCSDGDCVSFRLLFLPLLSFALVFLLPFQQFVFLMDQLPLGPISPRCSPATWCERFQFSRFNCLFSSRISSSICWRSSFSRFFSAFHSRS